MVITFGSILIGLLLLVRPLQRNPFYILHTAVIVLSAYYIETHYFRASVFGGKTLLLFLVFQMISINLVVILAYWLDKRAAVRGTWRVPERNLHALEFLGGWLGARIAQKVFHHKNKKKSYQAVFWFLGFAQIAAVVLILRFLQLI